MKTVVYLDMDGTISNLYGIENWLVRLRNEDSTIFTECETLITEKALFDLYPVEKYEIRILSMTPKKATKRYCMSVIAQKNEWLDTHFPHIKKRIYLPYGHNKNLNNSANTILIDFFVLMRRRPPSSTLGDARFPCTSLCRSR